jgi:hypothetical protein
LAFFAQEETGEDLNQARIIPIRQEQLKKRFVVEQKACPPLGLKSFSAGIILMI